MNLNELKNKLTEANITTFNTENGFDVDINSKKKFLNLIAKLGNHNYMTLNSNGISYFTESSYHSQDRYPMNCSTHLMIKTVQQINVYGYPLDSSVLIEVCAMDKDGKYNEISFYLNK